MDLDDIFRLLLLVLLVADRQLADGETSNETTSDNVTAPAFSYAPLNELMIITMFIKLFAAGRNETSPRDTTF